MIHIPNLELEELEGAITNLESPRPQQYQTGLLRSLLTKLKRTKKLEQAYIDLLDHVGDKFEGEEYHLEATPLNIEFAQEASDVFYGDASTPVHIHEGFIWISDKVLFDYIAHCLENGRGRVCEGSDND